MGGLEKTRLRFLWLRFLILIIFATTTLFFFSITTRIVKINIFSTGVSTISSHIRFEDVEMNVDMLTDMSIKSKDDIVKVEDCLSCPISSIHFNETSKSLTNCSSLTNSPNISPPSLTSYLKTSPLSHFWVAYVGDSLLRSPFLNWANLLTPPEFENIKRNFNITWYHKDQIFCCPSISYLSLGTGEGCYFGRIDFDFKIPLQNVAADYLSQGGVCISWQWQENPDDTLIKVIDNLTNTTYPPTSIIVNPGLHSIMSGWSTDRFEIGIRNFTNYLSQSSAKSSFIFHDISATIEKDLPPHKKASMGNSRVNEFNSIVKSVLDSVNSSSILRIPVNELTRNGDAIPNGDGVHYHGDFQNIIVNIDLAMIASQIDNKWKNGFCQG